MCVGSTYPNVFLQKIALWSFCKYWRMDPWCLSHLTHSFFSRKLRHWWEVGTTHRKGRFLLFPCRGCSTGSRGTGVRMAAEDALRSSADRSEASSADQRRPAGASCEPHPSFSETPSGGSDVTWGRPRSVSQDQISGQEHESTNSSFPWTSSASH
jgi:hypothetical protein